MKIVIANFSAPVITTSDASTFWARHELPQRRHGLSLFEQPAGWGFHIMAIGLYLRDQGMADAVEFWTTRTGAAPRIYPMAFSASRFTTRRTSRRTWIGTASPTSS